MVDTPATPPNDVVARAQALVTKLMGDKSATGAAVRKTAKEMFPDISIPEDVTDVALAPMKADMADMRGQLDKALETIAARGRADEEARQMIDLETKVSAAAREFNLTDSGRQKMLERMKEMGNVSDAQAAAAYVVSQMPKPAPNASPSWLPQEANMWGSSKKDEAFEALHMNPQKYMDDQLREFTRDPDKYVAETFGTA